MAVASKLCKSCRKNEYPDSFPFCSSCADAGWDKAYRQGVIDALEAQRLKLANDLKAAGLGWTTPTQQSCKWCGMPAGPYGTGRDLCDECWRKPDAVCVCGCKQSIHDRLAPHYKKNGENTVGLCSCRKFEQAMEPCGMFNCKNPKPKGAFMCASCAEDYKNDPDAYK